jgi:hypothetical protein
MATATIMEIIKSWYGKKTGSPRQKAWSKQGFRFSVSALFQLCIEGITPLKQTVRLVT